MEALTATERDFEQAAVYWKQEAEKHRLAGLADKERMDWLELMREECEGRVLSRCFAPLGNTLRAAIDEAMRQCQPESINVPSPAE